MAESKKGELFSYQAPWPIYGMNWSQRPSQPFRLAVGSFIEEYTNKVQVVQLNQEKGEFEKRFQLDHPYPTTKIMWIPDEEEKFPDLLATTGDYLRIWRVNDDQSKASMDVLLNNNKTSEFCAPLTSFDWNETDPRIIGTSSIDTTCTIWDINAQKGQKVGGEVKTQLIAHDLEVYDIAFAKGVNVFASVGADGSVRMFDLRSLDHSTIIYEDVSTTPLLRLAWNKQDPNYLSTFKMDDNKVIILDIRVPCVPVAELASHEAHVNGMAWAPHSSCHICTAADDKKALIWDIQQIPKCSADPILAYDAAGPINQIQWSKVNPDWVAIAFNQTLEVLRV
eukprot:m.286770 g.286770  ORF g.286770 m.286770 type:complete len:337 (+) comp11637_c0_seq1:34-1044(+)